MNKRINLLFGVFTIMALLMSACAKSATLEPTVPLVEPTQGSVVELTNTPAASPTIPAVDPTKAPTIALSTVLTVMLPEVDPASVSGDIIAAGSSTVYPLAEVMADRFKRRGLYW